MAIRYTFPSPLKITIGKLLLILLFLPSVCIALPLEYNASYNIEKYGIVIAKSSYSLKHENNGLYMTQHTETMGLAALLRSDTIDEYSILSDQNGQLLLTEYSYKQRPIGKKNRDIQFKIDWLQSEEKLLGKVSGTANGKKLELKIDKPVWDTCSYQIPLMQNVKEKNKSQQYSLMTKGHFKDYSYITRGAEEVEINGHTIQTIKIERNGKTNKRPVYLWLAPSLNNLPVKVEKWKDGTLYLKMLLNQVQFPSDPTMKFNADTENTGE